MTKEHFLTFQPFEKQLASAKNSNFARFPHRELLEFDKAVAKWRGKGLGNNEKTCPHCLLRLLKEVGAEYFRYKDSPRGKALLKSQENGETEIKEDGGGAARE